MYYDPDWGHNLESFFRLETQQYYFSTSPAKTLLDNLNMNLENDTIEEAWNEPVIDNGPGNNPSEPPEPEMARLQTLRREIGEFSQSQRGNRHGRRGNDGMTSYFERNQDIREEIEDNQNRGNRNHRGRPRGGGVALPGYP